MAQWLLAALLVLQAHFAASYIVPLDKDSQGTLGGLLRWAWPWGLGDGGLLGQITAAGVPVPGFFLAVTTAGEFVLAALAVVGIWIPSSWWRVLVVGGAALSLVLMTVFFGPTKILPMALDLVVLWIALANWSAAPAP